MDNKISIDFGGDKPIILSMECDLSDKFVDGKFSQEKLLKLIDCLDSDEYAKGIQRQNERVYKFCSNVSKGVINQ